VDFLDADKEFSDYFGFKKPKARKRTAKKSTRKKGSKKANAKTLKENLNVLTKKQLEIMANHHRIENPKKIKKADLIDILEELIQRHFSEDMFFFTDYQMILFTHSLRKDLIDFGEEKGLEKAFDDIFPNKQTFEEDFEKLKTAIIENEPKKISDLVSFGYLFVKGEFFKDGFEQPTELTAIAIKTIAERGVELIGYQALQNYIVSLCNLYGVSSYKQLHKVFKKHSGSSMSLKQVKDYTLKLSERSDFFIADDNYFYTILLERDEYELIVESDLSRDYYFPTFDEITTYAELRFPESIQKLFLEMKDILLDKTIIDDMALDEGISFEEAIETENYEIVADFMELSEKLLAFSKMGNGVYAVAKELDYYECRFKNLKELNKFYKIYHELQNKTRKWLLKGHLYSEL
jgi:hypothetical protein